MKIDQRLIREILDRGAEDIIVRESLEKKLNSGKKLRVKLGIDPTGPKIHLGRAITLRKLKVFQELGHQIILIIGDFTAQIGDPSDKLNKRPLLTAKQIKENLKTYLKQAGLVIDVKKAEVRYNSEWLKKLTFKETVALAEIFTVQQMLARRNFQDRYQAGQEISLREFLYPIMQGYDSVAVKADVEIGGFDQLFNLKAGREIQRYYGQEPQDILTVSMLEGTDGRKMSTSWGNVINMADEPNDMFGKIMAMRDDLIVKYFTLCTDRSLDEIKRYEQDLKKGTNPRDIKFQLALDIIGLYHGQDQAQAAGEKFNRVFKNKEKPEEIPVIKIKGGQCLLVEVLAESKLAASKSEARRLVEQGGVRVNDKVIKDIAYKVNLGQVLVQVGKRRFARLQAK